MTMTSSPSNSPPTGRLTISPTRKMPPLGGLWWQGPVGRGGEGGGGGLGGAWGCREGRAAVIEGNRLVALLQGVAGRLVGAKRDRDGPEADVPARRRHADRRLRVVRGGHR